MCRFLLHILPRGFHRIRYYGLLANVEVAKLNLAQISRATAAGQGDAARQSPRTQMKKPEPMQPTFYCSALRRPDDHPG